MVLFDFFKFIDLLKIKLVHLIQTEPGRFSIKTTPTDFEKIVVFVSEEIIREQNLDMLIEYDEGSHTFPDIVFKFKNFSNIGIEVKSSTNINTPVDSWTTLGNSILGSTKVIVDDLFIMFFKVTKDGCKLKIARYEESVSDIVVTHSPRFKLNLNQDPSDSFFQKSGISYLELNSSEDPISLVKEFYRNQGKTAWWIAESTPAVIRSWDELDIIEVKEIYSKSFLFFPEIIWSSASNKYKQLAKWLAANYSLVDTSLRDRFSAGGKVDLYLNGKNYSGLPRVFEKLYAFARPMIELLDSISEQELQEWWISYGPETDNISSRMSYWFQIISEKLVSVEKKEILNFIRDLFPEIPRP